MKLKKKLSVAAVVSILVLSLVGCGGNNNSMNSSDSEPTNNTITSESLEEKMANEAALTEEEVQKAMQEGLIERFD